jgi:hypothetical protein
MKYFQIKDKFFLSMHIESRLLQFLKKSTRRWQPGDDLISLAINANDIALLCFSYVFSADDRLCGLVVRVLGYRSGGPDSIPDTTRKKK